MKIYRKTATLVGSAFLFSNITFILGAIVMVESILGSPDYLNLISASRAQIWNSSNHLEQVRSLITPCRTSRKAAKPTT